MSLQTADERDIHFVDILTRAFCEVRGHNPISAMELRTSCRSYRNDLLASLCALPGSELHVRGMLDFADRYVTRRAALLRDSGFELDALRADLLDVLLQDTFFRKRLLMAVRLRLPGLVKDALDH